MIIHYKEDLIDLIDAQGASKIGFTSGCFDLLHPLHVEYLNKCKRECDKLYVFIDSDMLVQQNKQKTPLINEMDRAYMVDNLRSVSGTMIINSLYEMGIILYTIQKGDRLQKHSYFVFKHNTTVYGQPLLETPDMTNVIIPDVTRFQSTTEITNHLKQQ